MTETTLFATSSIARTGEIVKVFVELQASTQAALGDIKSRSDN